MRNGPDNASDQATALTLPEGVSLSPATPSGQVRTNRMLVSVLIDHEDRLDRIEAALRRLGYEL
ncbi:MAG TPA: hypothetical protein VNI34_06585 [Candidatus Nitrosotalea sp.]|nr:hypothetical protein [Candidatus Nitrosotalea sp.]